MAGKKVVDAEDLNNLDENLYAGCIGAKISHAELDDFLETNFEENNKNEEKGLPKFAQIIWSIAGVGKTDHVKSFRGKDVMWRGEKRKWTVVDIPLAQFEEMGDLHGLPVKCSLVKKNGVEKWIETELVVAYEKLGWELDLEVPTCTRTSPPGWVPRLPGPTILLIDDINRASIRIIKGSMQLIQNYRMVSWDLPEGCQIVATANPDGGEYLVTSLDPAIITRCQHITLKADAPSWIKWANEHELDDRGIFWILTYPEMLTSWGEKRLTNPRTLSKFFSFSKNIKDEAKLRMHGLSLIDEETWAAFSVFLNSEYNLCIDPMDILNNNEAEIERLHKIMTSKKKKIITKKKVVTKDKEDKEVETEEEIETEVRIDVAHITIERLILKILKMKKEEIKKEYVLNLCDFLFREWLPIDKVNAAFRRIADFPDGSGAVWVTGGNDKNLQKIRSHIIELNKII